MKTKKFNKTLALNKMTIANLGDGEMNRIQGGVSTDFQSCDSYCASICPVKCPTPQDTAHCDTMNTQYSECWTTPIWGC